MEIHLSLKGKARVPKAFPFRGVERPENSTARCFQRDGDGSPVERWHGVSRDG